MGWVGFTVFYPEIGKLLDPLNCLCEKQFISWAVHSPLAKFNFLFWLKGEWFKRSHKKLLAAWKTANILFEEAAFL